MDKKWEKWIWIELLGFDNTQSDYGVSDLLRRMNVIPTTVLLYVSTPDLFLSYDPATPDFTLPSYQCSHGGRPYGEERARQVWNTVQLRGLICELQKHGLQVYLYGSDCIISEKEAKKRGVTGFDRWAAAHPEANLILNTGAVADCLCQWRILSDGRSFGEVFTEKLQQFMRDFPFDGFMLGDGLLGGRACLIEGDFSDQMISRFEEAKHLTVPAGSTLERSNWIIENRRGEWCEFVTDCQSAFFKQVLAGVHALGKPMVALSAWTKDPFEAIWRCSSDYRVMAEAGLDAMIVESSAGTIELEDWNEGEDSYPVDRSRAMLLRLSACLPNMKLVQLHCVKDDLEEYCVVRHSPEMAATEILGLATMRLADRDQRALSGVVCCLADGMTAEEWHTLDAIWQKSFTFAESRPRTPMVLWCDDAIDPELHDYAATRRCNSYRGTVELLAHGLPLAWSATAAGAEKYPDVPAVIVSPRFWPQEVLKKCLDRPAPVLLAGILSDDTFGAQVWQKGKLLASIGTTLAPRLGKETLRFWHTLNDCLPPGDFWDEAVALFGKYVPFVTRGESYRIEQIYKFDASTVRYWDYEDGSCLAANMSRCYQPSRFIVPEKIRNAVSHTYYPCLPVKLEQLDEGTKICVKIPPLGTVLLTLQK